jgi:hypothetical protein
MNNEILLVIFVALTGFALLVQAIVMLVALIVIRKRIVSIQSDFEEIRTSVMPILTKSRETIDSVAPKIESIASDVADLAKRFREQGAEFQATSAELMERIQKQTVRVDNMFTGLIDGLEHASNVVADSVTRPVRQVNAMLAAAKAFLSVLTSDRRPGQQAKVVADQDMFV